jgi:hypothetical protein
MKRRDEEISRRSFVEWANAYISERTLEWIEVSQEEEPPDWYLDVEDYRFAVETTSIVEYLWAFDPPLSSFAIAASLTGFVDTIEREAKSRGPLNGAYLVSLAPIPRFRENEKWLYDELMSYIERTRHLPSAERFDLGRIKHQTISISKLESKREYVKQAVSFGAKFEGEAFEDLVKIIALALEKKSSRLQEISHPIVLLQLDAFHYSGSDDWRQALLRSRVPAGFDAVFRTMRDATAQLLYHRSKWWHPGRSAQDLDA